MKLTFIREFYSFVDYIPAALTICFLSRKSFAKSEKQIVEPKL